MSATVWKFPFPLHDYVEISMPVGARVLCVGEQRGAAVLWAIVDPVAVKETRRFRVAGTGHELGPVGEYVGTFHLLGGDFIGHVFGTEPEPLTFAVGDRYPA